MIKVWSDLILSGRLDRLNDRGTTFSYDPGADPLQAVSVTMPVRLQSWDSRQGLLPIFEMNLPEGYLRDRISRQFAKSLGKFDDFDLLSVIGRLDGRGDPYVCTAVLADCQFSYSDIPVGHQDV